MEVERRNHLLAVVSNAAAAHKDWVENGDTSIVPGDAIYTRFQEIADHAAVINRQRAEPLEQLFLEFGPHWQAFVSAQQTTADLTMLPSEQLWDAWEELVSSASAAKMPKLKRIEPIKDLKEQKVPDRQICMIYGFLDEDGQADHQKLAEEVAEPGTHTGDGWVAPVNRDLALKIKQIETENETINRRRAAKVAAATTPAKESIEQLVAGGCSAQQIAKMRKITPDAVYQYCKDHGLPAPPFDYTGVLLSPAGSHDPDVSPERQKMMDTLGPDRSPQNIPPAHPMRDRMPRGPAAEEEGEDADDDLPAGLDLSTLPPEEANAIQEAVAYFNQGMDVSAIATAMSTEGTKVHGNKVRAMLQKAGIDLSPARA